MIFVFGSNLKGIHGKGAALTAKLHHGAIQGIGEGLMGQSYALPTKHTPTVPMQLFVVRNSVKRFISFAESRPDLEFQVTQVGCGLGGHSPFHVAPMFLKAPPNCLFDDAWRPRMESEESCSRNDGIFDFRYWGTFP